MATYSTGLSATWGGVAFTEVYDVSTSLFGGPRRDRALDGTSTGWTDQVGSVTVSTYGTANMSIAEYGTRKTLTLSGGGVSLTFPALCTGLSVTPQLNGVTRYDFTAQLLDT